VQIRPQIFPILGGITELSCRGSDGISPVDASDRVSFMLVQLFLSLSFSFSLWKMVFACRCDSTRARLFPCIIDTDSFASLSRGFDPPRQSGKMRIHGAVSKAERRRKPCVRQPTREQRCGPARRFSSTRHRFPDNSLPRAIAKLLVGS